MANNSVAVTFTEDGQAGAPRQPGRENPTKNR